jgi:hypothetical protein
MDQFLRAEVARFKRIASMIDKDDGPARGCSDKFHPEQTPLAILEFMERTLAN